MAFNVASRGQRRRGKCEWTHPRRTWLVRLHKTSIHASKDIILQFWPSFAFIWCRCRARASNDKRTCAMRTFTRAEKRQTTSSAHIIGKRVRINGHGDRMFSFENGRAGRCRVWPGGHVNPYAAFGPLRCVNWTEINFYVKIHTKSMSFCLITHNLYMCMRLKRAKWAKKMRLRNT